MKIDRAIRAIASAGCCALLLAASSAQTPSSDTAGSNASAADKTFARKALAGGMAEVELGQLAAQKANSEDVKQFGQKMADDHSKLNDQMKPVAAQLGVTPPDGIPAAEKALEAKLKMLSGEAFDKAYMKAMVKDHRQDLMEFKKEVATGKSSALKDAASQGQQVIAEHLKMAEDIAKKVGAGVTSTTAKNE